MNKNNKNRQCRHLQNKLYSACGINPKDISSHDYFYGNISDLLMMVSCASFNIQDMSNVAKLKKPPKWWVRQDGLIIEGGWCGDAWSTQPCWDVMRNSVCWHPSVRKMLLQFNKAKHKQSRKLGLLWFQRDAGESWCS